MSEDVDPLEQLRERLHQESDLPGPDSAEAHRVHTEVVWRERRRRRARMAVLLPVAALLIAAGFVIFGQRTSTTVVCFEQVDTDSSRFGPSPEAGVGVEACSGAWETGELSNPDVLTGSVPHLTGCVSETGSLWVFPSDVPDVCTQLGLTEPDPSQDLTVLTELEERLGEYVGIDTCVPPEQAVAGIEEILDELELSEWSVVAQPQGPDSPCASFGIDGDEKIVYMIPGPPARSDP